MNDLPVGKSTPLSQNMSIKSCGKKLRWKKFPGKVNLDCYFGMVEENLQDSGGWS